MGEKGAVIFYRAVCSLAKTYAKTFDFCNVCQCAFFSVLVVILSAEGTSRKYIALFKVQVP